MPDYIEELNEGQRNAVLYNDGPSLVIAGAGSGKTRVLTYKIAYLLENGYQPWNILALTFTNKAAGELRQRLIDMIGEDAEKINASTFHSACVKILRREIENLGYQRSFTIYDDDDSKRIIKDAMKKLNLDEKVFNPKVFKNMISRCKDKMISPEEYAPMANASGELMEKRCAEVYTEYQSALRSASAVDFDDIIYLTVKLFEDFPDVLSHYQHLYLSLIHI